MASIVIQIEGRTRMKAFVDYLRGVEKSKIQVGIFDNKSAAYKAFMAEFGKVALSALDGPNIPARPFMTRTAHALERESSTLSMRMREVLRKHSLFQVAKVLGKHIAQRMKNEVNLAHEWAAPLKPYTVEKKGHDQPLVETYEMLENIKYRIEGSNNFITPPMPMVRTHKIRLKKDTFNPAVFKSTGFRNYKEYDAYITKYLKDRGLMREYTIKALVGPSNPFKKLVTSPEELARRARHKAQWLERQQELRKMPKPVWRSKADTPLYSTAPELYMLPPVNMKELRNKMKVDF